MGWTSPTAADPLEAGRAALRGAAWDDARSSFAEAVRSAGSPEAWEGLSRAQWWLGDQDATLEARECAYRAYVETGDARGAARMAMWLGSDHLDFRGDEALAAAWLARGRTMLRDSEPCAELGYILLLDADIALLARGDPASAGRLAHEGLDLARRVGDAGAEVVALAILGSSLVVSGAVVPGLRCLEECAALAIGEDFIETTAPGWALCHVVSACTGVGDFRRAAQWCRTLHTWSEAWHARHFFGACRTAYGEVLAMKGEWASAEEELLSALGDLRTTRPALAAPTAVQLGRLRVRQGDAAQARVLFTSALPLPQAILAIGEMDLAEGDVDAGVVDAAERVLRRLRDASVLARIPALELLARAHAADGRTKRADQAASELEGCAEQMETPYMLGRARLLRARVRAAASDHEGARRSAEDAVDLFTGCPAPYEAAEARLLLSSVLEAMGRHQRARSESDAAAEALALLHGRNPTVPALAEGRLTAREVDILRLVARGLGDAQIADRLFLSPHTVHRHVANIRTKLDVPSRAAAVAHATSSGLL